MRTGLLQRLTVRWRLQIGGELGLSQVAERQTHRKHSVRHREHVPGSQGKGMAAQGFSMDDGHAPDSNAFQKQLEKRKNDPNLDHLEETVVDWVDSPTQKLDVELVLQLVRKMGDTLGQGELHNHQSAKLQIRDSTCYL